MRFGNDIPCEVRWVRLQSGEHRLIRGSITDITERKRTELMAAGERRVFERLAANVDLRITLEAITEVVERVAPDSVCAIRMLDENGNAPESLRRSAPARRVRARDAKAIAVAARNGSCAAAVYLQRQVIVADIARDALWENMRDVVLAAGSAQLLVDADSRVRRPHPRHARAVFPHAAQPAAPRLRADGAHDAARRHRDRAPHGRRARCAPARRAIAACSTT